tara:strand:- start:392 stop:1678 length:1287 start_codon:yes stop_codon:yes gene_type:complete
MTAISDILSDNDSLSVIVQSLDAKLSLRSASIVNRAFHVAVRNERTRRLASTHKQYAYIGGGADKDEDAVARIDVVGLYDTILPPLAEPLLDTSAAVLDDGRIVVVGNRPKELLGENGRRNPPVVYVFDAKHWRWYKVSAPNALALSTLVPYPGGRFAAIGGYDDNKYSSNLSIYSPVQGEPFLYEEEVESLEFACCGPAALTRSNGQTTFLAYHENGGNEIGGSVKRPPLVFPDRTSGVLEKMPCSMRSLCVHNDLEPSAAWLTIDVKGGATPATEVAVVVQPTASQKKALVWMSLPHGSWRKVAFMSVDAAASPNDGQDASDGYMFDMLNPPHPAIVVLDGERHLAFAACLWDSDTDNVYYDVWMGATLREVVAAMALPQRPSVYDDEEEDEDGFEARGLVPMCNLSGDIHTPIRHQSCLVAFAPY